MSERTVTRNLVDKLESILGKDLINIYDELFPKNKIKLRKLFQRASKSLTGNNGFPDLIIEFRRKKNSPYPPNLYIIIEVKRHNKNHIHDSKNPLNTQNPKRYACGGVIHYLRSAYKELPIIGKDLDFIGIGYTEEDKKSKIDIYGLCSKFCTLSNIKIHHFKNSNLENLGCVIKDLYSFKNITDNHWSKSYQGSEIGYLPINDMVNIKFSLRAGKIKFQREISQYSVEKITNFYRKEYTILNKIHPQGIILLGFFETNYYIIDGQHRLEAYRKLHQEGITNYSVLYQLKKYSKLPNMIKDFKAHNSGTSLTEIESEYVNDIEEALSLNRSKKEIKLNENTNDVEKEIKKKEDIVSSVTIVCDILHKQYPAFFSDTSRCYRPNLHYNTLKCKLQSKILEKVNCNDIKYKNKQNLIDIILDMIQKLNTDIEKKEKNNKKVISVYQKCIKKGGLYLGIVAKYKWIDDLKSCAESK